MSSFKPLQLYYLNLSRSERLVWLLTEMNVPYELRLFKRDKGMRIVDSEIVKEGVSGPSAVEHSTMKSKHELAKAPILIDPNNNDYVVAESGFIFQYVLENFSSFNKKLYIPEKSKDRKLYDQTSYYFHFSEGTLQPINIMKLIHDAATTFSPFFVRPVVSAIIGKIDSLYTSVESRASIEFLEHELEKCLEEFPDDSRDFPYFIGNKFSAVDINLFFPVDLNLKRFHWTESDYPLLYKWHSHLKENENNKKSVAIGKTY